MCTVTRILILCAAAEEPILSLKVRPDRPDIMSAYSYKDPIGQGRKLRTVTRIRLRAPLQRNQPGLSCHSVRSRQNWTQLQGIEALGILRAHSYRDSVNNGPNLHTVTQIRLISTYFRAQLHGNGRSGRTSAHSYKNLHFPGTAFPTTFCRAGM